MLDSDTATFIQSGVSISLAAAGGASGLPCMSRGLGCKVLDEGRRVGIFVGRSQARELLDNIRCSGRVANVFSLPSSNLTVQLKGVDARVEAATAEDEAGLLPYAAAMAARLAPFRVPEIYARTLFSGSADDLVAVSFTPSQGFGQTPGPRAGMPLADGKP